MANIKVAVRIRPISEREAVVTGSEIVVHTDMQEVSLTNLKVSSGKTIDSRERTKRYRFDYCFDSSDSTSENYANQAKIYETLGQSVIDALFSGYNACLVAYGQSASGKTYTMMGTNDDPGLIPRICDGLFLRAGDEKNCEKISRISVSYLEVYNERVRDLLVPAANLSRLRVREHPRLGPYVHGLTQHPVDTLDSLMSRVEEGSKTRKTASTLQNPSSSRSHALLTLTVNTSNGSSANQAISRSAGGSKKTDFPSGCRLHLVDLAGSENSAASAGVNRLKSQEGANINKSLVALGNVISALAERSSILHGSTRKFIPYRDSTLTWLLKDSLGGNATTIMLATISPASGSYNETSHTLRFAQRAQSVINKPVINEDPVAKIIRELRDEVQKLKALLLEKNSEFTDGHIPSCICKRTHEQTTEYHSLDTRRASTSTSNSPTIEQSPSAEGLGKCHSSIDSSSSTSKSESANPSQQFGSLEFIPGFNDSETLPVTTSYCEAKVSELIEDKVDEPVFVDIPTLVAVLIKPDNSVEVDTHQIEEILSDGVPDDNIDTDFNATNVACLNPLISDPSENISENNKVVLDQSLKGNQIQVKTRLNSADQSSFIIESNKNTTQETPQSLDQNSVDTDVVTTLVNGKRILSLPEKLNKFCNNSPAVDKTSGKISNKVSKVKGTTPRKSSIDNINRNSNKDSNSSISKDEQTVLVNNISNDKSGRKNSLDIEQVSSRPHTIIQRPRRADIVAAVTERLYSKKKILEDSNTTLTSVSDIRSREDSEVTLVSSTKMRLQEISRKMLAKRRKICVETQTDNLATVRVKDVSISVQEPKIIRKDASMLTDRHENYDILLPYSTSLLRVKEVSTSTSDSPPPKNPILFKDASNITEISNDNDYQAVDYYHQDSGIVSDIFMSGTHTYADSNISVTDISDILPDTYKENPELSKFITTSSNTDVLHEVTSTSAQTMNPHVNHNCIDKCHNTSKCIKANSAFISKSCSRNSGCSIITLPYSDDCHRSLLHNNHWSPNTSCESYKLKDDQSERSVISIALPDMINITIESPNILESKIQVFDSNDQNQKDVSIQTENKKYLEASTVTNENCQDHQTQDSETSIKSNTNQSDTKTFRIENIFQNPHEGLSKCQKINENASGLNNTFLHTNSTSTSFQEINEEESKCHSFRTSLSPSGTRRKLVTSELTRTNIPGQHINHDNNVTPDLSSTLTFSDRTIKQPNSERELISWQDIRTKILNENDSVIDIKNQLKCLDEVENSRNLAGKFLLSNNNITHSSTKISPKCLITDKIISEQETNFSDDSLDGKSEGNESAEKSRISESLNEDITDFQCPPDVVAHTKKDSLDALALCDDTLIPDDFNDTYVELPRTKLGIVPTGSITRTEEFRSLLIGVPLIPITVSEDNSQKSTMITAKNKKKVSFGDTNVINTTASTMNDYTYPHSSHEVVTHNPTTESEKNVCTHSFPEKSKLQYPIVKNIKLENSTDSHKSSANVNNDLESDNSTRTNENSYNKRNILEEYMNEAILYMRNINSLNQLTSTLSNERDNAIYPSKNGYCSSRSKNKGRSINNENCKMETGPYDTCLKSMERLEKCLNQVKHHDKILQKSCGVKVDASAETKFHLAKFSSDSVKSCWSCSRLLKYPSLDDLNKKWNIESDNFPHRYFHNSKCSMQLYKQDKKIMDDILQDRKLYRKHSQLSNNLSKMKLSNESKCSAKDHQSHHDTQFGELVNDKINIYPVTMENEDALIARVQKSLPIPRCTISKYDSANENSNYNDEFNAFIEPIHQITRPKYRFKRSASPRVKFLQLLTERRRIIDKSQNTTAS